MLSKKYQHTIMFETDSVPNVRYHTSGPLGAGSEVGQYLFANGVAIIVPSGTEISVTAAEVKPKAADYPIGTVVRASNALAFGSSLYLKADIDTWRLAADSTSGATRTLSDREVDGVGVYVRDLGDDL